MRTVNPEQHARKRARILEAAAFEFAAGGVDGTSTADICRRAGIGSGTLFHYFPTKRDVFHALFADDLARNAEVCAQALTAEDPAEGVRQVVEHLLADLANPLVPGLMATVLLQVNRDPEFAELMAGDEQRTRAALTELLGRMDPARLAFPPERVAAWIHRVADATFFAAAEDTFDPAAELAEFRRLVTWLTGGCVAAR
ncbi:TetR/AcrR family transcriptional regulator [Amycolatopsis magusensis]|uniref:AcrR family transcriptional regulator n=1 Tax=Amycolatopsis magusensis TaxID=882444 RepID=A0ABS4PND9_9PSEU|nr:TetR/AcrR family transcriptional regulator [Amycolatopsis magusensis]MBP2180146.1 AcrR family transcriptional regulator [Amycolatopsis magusensis]